MQDPIKELITTFHETSRLFTSFAAHTVDEKRATMLQFKALDLIKNSSDLSNSDIAKQLRLSKSSVTQLVERLVQAKLVTRKKSTRDKRVILLALTAAGKRERDQLAMQLYNNCSLLLNYLSKEDVQQLLAIHKKLLAHLRVAVPCECPEISKLNN